MSDIFVAVPGRMVAIQSDSARGIIIQIGGFESTGVLVGLHVAGSVAAQFQPSLNQSVYITPFGDNVGSLTAELWLNDTCATSGTASVGNGTRLSAFLNLYSNTRLSPTRPTPLRLIVGTSVFTGFATQFTVDATSIEGTVIHGNIQFAAWLSYT